jgi:hypothetical protein
VGKVFIILHQNILIFNFFFLFFYFCINKMASNFTLCANNVSTHSLNVSAPRPVNQKVAAALTLTADDHGKTFLLDASTSFAVTLPTATTEAAAEALVGTHFRFVLDVDHATNDITIVGGDASNDKIDGNVVQIADGAAAAAITVASDIITFDASAAMAVGDFVDVVCTHGTASLVRYIATGVATD